MVGEIPCGCPIGGTINFLELPKLIFASKNVKRLMCRKTNCLITDFHAKVLRAKLLRETDN
jgi:hypothetical protein